MFMNHIKAWAFPTSRPRRGHDTRAEAVDSQMKDDLGPPIPLRASFRLRRKTEQLPSTASPLETSGTSSSYYSIISSLLSLTFVILLMNSANY
ncbi:unnamed protein product [Strongylus vulgaris]|uniref:Uncharacterized protein n=1 Tax=Strongylus vulgaris TaxID=40348 RepID=A0A3P7JK77_STRVU|nr:unnamed protein product [Strongylus vulgaris]